MHFFERVEFAPRPRETAVRDDECIRFFLRLEQFPVWVIPTLEEDLAGVINAAKFRSVPDREQDPCDVRIDLREQAFTCVRTFAFREFCDFAFRFFHKRGVVFKRVFVAYFFTFGFEFGFVRHEIFEAQDFAFFGEFFFVCDVVFETDYFAFFFEFFGVFERVFFAEFFTFFF
jgi:hypothetical protein